MEKKDNNVGTMIVSGYQPEELRFNSNHQKQYVISICSDSKVYIKEKDEAEWEQIDSKLFEKSNGPLDSIMHVYRFKITDGKYQGEYVLDSIEETSMYKDKNDYLSWMS